MASTGVIFDFNGTMVIDMPLHLRAWHALCQEALGRPLTGEEEQSLSGRDNTSILKELLGPGRPAAEYERLSSQKERLYRELTEETGLELVEGLPAFLDALKAEGFALNIASASIWANIEFYFSYYGLDRWFDLRRVAYDDGIMPPKPDPALYRQAITAIGLAPQQVTIFEDSPPGISAARGVEPGGIWVRTAHPPADPLPFVHRYFADYTNLRPQDLR